MTYNPNFQWKRKTVTISVPTSSLPAGYQVKLIIPKENEMQSDFRDLRFETTDGYGLSHWLGSINTTPNPDEATIWVKLKDTVTAPTSINIYMYYGNPYVSSTSNGTNTFDFFDDFNGASIDSSKWTSSGTVSVSGGKVNISGLGSYIIGKTLINSDSSIIINESQTVIASAYMGLTNAPTGQTNSILIYPSHSNNICYRDTLKNGVLTETSSTVLALSSKELEMRWTTTSVDFLNNGVSLGTHTTNIPLVGLYPHAYSNSSSGVISFDYVYIRKYVATEPTTPTIGMTVTPANWNPQRKAITINTTTATPSNYQVKLTIPFAPEMNIDFSDLRFVSKTNVPLDYWIESSTPGVTTDIWVELVDSIGANSSDYIYMHYGNPNLTSMSNGVNTFALFDDFNDGDQSSWINNAGTWTESGGIRSQTSIASGFGKYSYKTLTGLSEYIVGVKFRAPVLGINDGRMGVLLDRDSGTDAIYVANYGSVTAQTQNAPDNESIGWGILGNNGFTLQANIWYIIEGYRGTNIQKSRIRQIGTSIPAWQGSGTFTNSANIQVGLIGAYDKVVNFDDFYVRKYITTEPSFSIGTAESMNSFSYRKTLTINNGSGGVLADYQILITVAYSSHMQSNFNDIRFVDINGNLLPYWIESKDSSTANIWIKVNLPNYGTTPTGDNIVYMYYGNSSLPSASDGPNTFIVFDHFEGNSLDTSKWVVSGAASYSVANSVLTVNGDYTTSDVSGVTSISTFNRLSTAIVTRYRFSTANSNNKFGVSTNGSGLTLRVGSYIFYHDQDYRYCFKYTDAGVATNVINMVKTTDYAIYEMSNDGTNIRWTVDGTLQATSASASYWNSNAYIRYTGFKASAGPGGPMEIDYVYVKKFVLTEPTYTISAEQTPTDITATFMSITPSETPCRHNICTVTISVTWRNDGIVSESFVPNITVDNAPISPAPYSSEVLDAGSNVSHSFTIYGLATGTRNICPSPN